MQVLREILRAEARAGRSHRQVAAAAGVSAGKGPERLHPRAVARSRRRRGRRDYGRRPRLAIVPEDGAVVCSSEPDCATVRHPKNGSARKAPSFREFTPAGHEKSAIHASGPGCTVL
jgi:hypothetical protein